MAFQAYSSCSSFRPRSRGYQDIPLRRNSRTPPVLLACTWCLGRSCCQTETTLSRETENMHVSAGTTRKRHIAVAPSGQLTMTTTCALGQMPCTPATSFLYDSTYVTLDTLL